MWRAKVFISGSKAKQGSTLKWSLKTVKVFIKVYSKCIQSVFKSGIIPIILGGVIGIIQAPKCRIHFSYDRVMSDILLIDSFE